ncbi:MAG: hypothetical protein JWP19_67 [Rhodoglobus sp.]|nr:hypothetical protein [Rhodoglobus sp.]
MFNQARPYRQTEKTLGGLIAGLAVAVLFGAGAVLLPMSASADTPDIGSLTAAADQARSAADAAELDAQAAEAAATAAADNATTLRAASDAAATASADAATAALGDPTDNDLQAAAAAALDAFVAADLAATTAEADAATAGAAAATARANADELEAAAQAAESALADASAANGTVEPPVTDSLKSTPEFNPCDLLNLNDTDNKFFCETPKPDIDIHVKNYCPTVVTVTLKHLVAWGHYELWINGVLTPFTIDNGSATVTVYGFTTGKFEVKVKYGDEKWTKDDSWIKYTCPEISSEVHHSCNVIGGTAKVEVHVGKLDDHREYTVTVTGPGGFSQEFTFDDHHSWDRDFDLSPGTYTVTVESDGRTDVGPVTYEFTVDPCPGNVTITFAPKCAVGGSGSLGAMLSGLVPGREYHVTLTGPNGLITDQTFTASAPTWAVPPSSLPAGTYTVKVVDTHGYVGDTSKSDEPSQHSELSWSGTGTVSTCPQLAMTGAVTGPATMAALVLLPLGGAFLLVSRVLVSRRNRME